MTVETDRAPSGTRHPVRTTCPYCGVGCGVLATPDGKGGAEIAGDPEHPANVGRLCSKGSALGETLSLDGRLLHPSVDGIRAGWDDALGTVTDGLRRVAEEYGPEAVAFYLSGQLLTEDYYVANKLAKGFIGTPNLDTNSRLCMSSAVAAHRRAFGSDTVPGCYEDFDEADLVVLVGSNAAWCHPVLFRRMVEARDTRGTRLVVLDPRRTQTGEEADLFLGLRPGTDTALFCGLLAHLAEAGILDRSFIAGHTAGFEGALERARAIAPDIAATAAATGLAPPDVAAFFDLFARTPRVVTAFSQGVNQSAQGTDKGNAIINCHLATGRIGKPGAGPFSLTGQPNAMGGREVGGLAIWVLNGAMAPFITQTFKLSPAETGFMISLPILAGALMRFPLGVLAQHIGRKNAAVAEMALIIAAMAFGYCLVDTFADVLAMGVLLGVASFGVALSLGSGWFPPRYKGLAMGIAGAGNSGTVLAVLFAPPLAQAYGWQTVYGFAGLTMTIPLIVMLVFAKEPPDRERQTLRQHVSCLVEKDGWAFSLVYIVTFGGFIGLSNFLPTFFHEQFAVTAVEAGRLTMVAALVGSGIRILGGSLADRYGGLSVLMLVLRATVLAMLLLATMPPLVPTAILFMLCFAALGAGNGALFQLVPLRWPTNTAIAGSMIGEIGALGGAILPAILGLSKQYTGSFGLGFLFYCFFAALVILALKARQRHWVGT